VKQRAGARVRHRQGWITEAWEVEGGREDGVGSE
jgi:hypothetical protein